MTTTTNTPEGASVEHDHRGLRRIFDSAGRLVYARRSNVGLLRDDQYPEPCRVVPRAGSTWWPELDGTS